LGTTLIVEGGLRLAGYMANLDLAEYPIKEVGRAGGILVAMLRGTAVGRAAVTRSILIYLPFTEMFCLHQVEMQC
jgi:hypothetical protein